MIMTTFEFSTHKPVHFGSDVVILTTASLFGEHGTGANTTVTHILHRSPGDVRGCHTSHTQVLQQPPLLFTALIILLLDDQDDLDL